MSNPIVRPGSDEEWEALLSQLRAQAQARPQPFFYARLHARLTARRPPAGAWLPGWVRRPAYALLLGAVVLAVSKDSPTLRPTVAASAPGNYQRSLPASLPNQ